MDRGVWGKDNVDVVGHDAPGEEITSDAMVFGNRVLQDLSGGLISEKAGTELEGWIKLGDQDRGVNRGGGEGPRGCTMSRGEDGVSQAPSDEIGPAGFVEMRQLVSILGRDKGR